MADNKIVITASLNIPESVNTIKSDLTKLEGELASKGIGLNINATINPDSLKTIQSQISEFSKGLTINVGAVNAKSIQQSVTEATKNQKVEVDITPKINKVAISKEAKELENILYMDFGFNRTKEEATALRNEFKNIITEYDKAFKSNNFNEAAIQVQKLADFCEKYYQGLDKITRELYEQEQAMKKLSYQSKIYINPSQYEEIKGAYGNNAKSYVDNILGIGNWSTKREGTTRDWSDFASEINQIINKDLYKVAADYYDTVARLNTVHPLEGLEQFENLLEQSARLAKANLDLIDEELQKNQSAVTDWYDTVYKFLAQNRGLSGASAGETVFFDEFISDESISHTEQNAKKLVQAYSTVQAAKDLYKDDKSVKSVTSDWVFDANKNITGFTININKLNGEVERLNHTITETGEVKFLGGSGSDKGVEKQAETMIKFVNEYTAKLNSLKAKVGEQFAPNITATLGDDMQKTTVTFDSFEKKLAELLKGNGNIGELRSEFTALDGVVKSLGAQLRGSDTSLNQFTNAINNARKFDNDLKALEVDYNNLNEKQRESETLTKSLADAQKKLSDLRNIQQTEGYTEKWITQYREASIALTQFTADLKLAKKLEQQDTSSVAHKQAVALAELRDAYREITSLSQKLYQSGTTGEYKTELERQISAQDEIIYKTMQRAKEEGLINQEFKQQIQLYATLQSDELSLMQSKLRTAEATKAATEQARQQAEALKERNQLYSDLTKWVDKYLQSLNAFNNSSITKKNSGNSNVASQVEENTKLIEQLEKIKASLSQGYDATKLQSLYQEFSKLSDPIKQAVANSAALKQSLLDTGLTQNVSNQIRNLTNQMNVFASTNKKATESLKQMRNGVTFADEWQRIKTALSSGTLDDAALKQLAQDFRNFKGEADSAGLTVNRFFQSMQSQLRMVLQRWISLYAVIGYIRKMIDAVKELDTAMINLKRVTDETDAGYERFLNDANELARTMKTTTSSLVEQAYQWSKLGFSINEALELAQASTVFMKVADVGQDQALSNLVTTLKAFRIEADRTMDVVDKLDKLNNRYAVSASGLGQGLERAASTMAMSGNTLEETLAMLTGAGEITQSLEETGNGIKILSLRLRGMKGALEELNEPVDDLMEVSKVQTQILNLTHNQVNIFDEATQEFRSTYDIMKDISDIWDSLSSTSRSNLTEILFGKQRSNIGLALIQAFQSGQVQNAFEDVTDAAGTATEEYEKMMNGVQAQFDALKGAAQEFANAFIKSDFVKGFAKFGTWLMSALTTITNKTNALVVVATPLLAFLGGKYKTNIFTLLINGIKGLVSAETGAITATGALTTALEVFKGALSGLAVGALIAAISWAIDELVVSESEMQESIDEITDSVSGLADATKDLKDAQSDIENTIASYSKIATTVADVNERKTQLLELQNNLQDTYKGEADGIDLVNGKYSEQIKKMKELAEEQRRQYEIENADKIAKARRLSTLSVTDIKSTETSEGTKYIRYDWKKDADRALFTLTKLNGEAIDVAQNIEGVYESYYDGTLYLSGTLEDARNQLGLIIENYKKFADENDKSLTTLIERYKELGGLLEDIKEASPYIEDTEPKPFFTGVFDGLADAMNQAVEDVTMQPFYDKLDEAQEKLKQLANPSDLTIAEYDTLYRDVQNLEHELYKLAGDSEESRQAVADLFNGFKQGISENGDHLEQFVEQFNTTLEESFKSVAETVTNVQDALNNLAEGKGLSHNEAWKLLKEDTEGYLRSIKLVNGEYYFSQEELIKFKDAKIKASVEDLKASNEQYKQERENLLKQLNLLNENLKTQLEIYNLKVMQRLATSSDLEEIEKIKINISETETSIKRCEDLWTRNNYLIEELNQNLGDTRVISATIETELNNTIKGFEDEIDAIEDTIDNLNDRKDIIEDEKKALEDELEILNEQKEALEQTIKNYDAVADAVSDYVKEQTDGIQKQIDALEEEHDAIEKFYNDQIDALKEQNEERDAAIKKEKALADLANAENQKKRTYSSARGWTYESSKEDIVQAQNALAEIETEEKIKALEKERDTKLGGFDERKKEYETQIKAFEEYAEKYSSIASDIQKAENELLADQILGSEWRTQIEQKDEELLNNYRSEYQQFNNDLKNLVNNEIASLQASIDKKDEEIKKIDDEINAYNKYKKSVENSLKEAQKALEDYKTAVEQTSQDVSKALETMEGNGWDRNWKMKQYNDEMAKSAESASERMCAAYGAVALALAELQGDIPVGLGTAVGLIMGIKGSHAKGGVADYTGLAMLHGSKSSPETIFNASDSKKLYDMIHNTPDLMASMFKEATQIAGFNPSNVKNSTNTNSVNVNIGQVVANNPQELTRNLDTHLDSYFRRKLTQGYAQ